jgi:hypothetical protein
MPIMSTIKLVSVPSTSAKDPPVTDIAAIHVEPLADGDDDGRNNVDIAGTIDGSYDQDVRMYERCG